MVNQVSWGVIATTNVRLNGTAFGNPISLSDALNDGHPYFYVSQLDESMKDIRAQNQCTLSLSEASLDCAALKLDPEDPRCTRLSLTGALKNVTDPSEHDKAQAVLFKQHPSMKSWPADHNWLIVKLDIQEIWLIDFFGGASDITPADYLAVKPIQRGTPADPSRTPVKPQPSFLKKADTARWLVHEATWGTFATTSVHLKGLPFANPVSIADGTDDDATGTPFFCVSPLDASMQDIAKNPAFLLDSLAGRGGLRPQEAGPRGSTLHSAYIQRLYGANEGKHNRVGLREEVTCCTAPRCGAVARHGRRARFHAYENEHHRHLAH